jgi:hypothetical protein
MGIIKCTHVDFLIMLKEEVLVITALLENCAADV